MESYANLSIYKLKNEHRFEFKEATFLNKKFPPHFHNHWSIAFIKAGSEMLFINGMEYNFSANTLIIIPPNIIHSHSGINDSFWEYEALYFEMDSLVFIPLYLQESLTESMIISTNITQLSNFKCFSHAFKSQQFNNVSFSYFIRDVVIDMQTSWINVVSNVVSSNMIEDIKIDLSSDFYHKITLDSLSKKYHVDKFKLLRSFKKAIGTTPNEYLLSMRIENAKQLIHQGYPLLDSALDSGFYDQSHFYNYFKKYVGISPSEYKRKLQYITSLS